MVLEDRIEENAEAGREFDVVACVSEPGGAESGCGGEAREEGRDAGFQCTK